MIDAPNTVTAIQVVYKHPPFEDGESNHDDYPLGTVELPYEATIDQCEQAARSFDGATHFSVRNAVDGTWLAGTV